MKKTFERMRMKVVSRDRVKIKLKMSVKTMSVWLKVVGGGSLLNWWW